MMSLTEDLLASVSNIRKGKYIPVTTPADAALSRSGILRVLKQGGVDSSGQRLISSFGKTKIIAFI